MPEDAADLGSKLTQLAEGVLDDLLREQSALDQRIDAIKTIGTLYLGLRKLAGRVSSEDEDAGGASLPAMRARIAAVNGEGK